MRADDEEIGLQPFGLFLDHLPNRSLADNLEQAGWRDLRGRPESRKILSDKLSICS